MCSFWFANTNWRSEEEIHNPDEEAYEGQECVMKLNDQQRDALNKIIEAIDNQGTASRCFYLDGPGGSGKTFLYKTLLAYLWGQGKVVLPFETTGMQGPCSKEEERSTVDSNSQCLCLTHQSHP
jgi:hypothetical protein